jgi:hypothetical protein
MGRASERQEVWSSQLVSRNTAMSALGHKRTSRNIGAMSALPTKADIHRRD